MKKTIILISILVILLAAAAVYYFFFMEKEIETNTNNSNAAANINVPDGWIQYTSEQASFSFWYPSDYELKEYGEAAGVEWIEDENADLEVSTELSFSLLNKDDPDMGRLYEWVMNGYVPESPMFRNKNKKEITLGNYTFTFFDEDDDEIYYFLINQDRVYFIQSETMRHPSHEINKQIISTFQILNEGAEIIFNTNINENVNGSSSVNSNTNSNLNTNTVTSNTNQMLDQDGDGLSDAEEEEYGTDPTKADTDGDGYDDKTEIDNGFNPIGEGKISSNSQQVKDRDARRVSYIKQIQSTLELYYNNQVTPSYPADGVAGLGGSTAIGTLLTTVASNIPVAPIPPETGCSAAQNSYTYASFTDAARETACDEQPCTYYTIGYCLGGTTAGIEAGPHTACERGIACET